MSNAQFGLFFDGTGNNYEVDKQSPTDDYEPTNIAKLFELYNQDDSKAIGKCYVNGIGTGGVNLKKQDDDADYSNLEMAFGIGIQKRVDEGLKKLKAFAKATQNIQNIDIDIFGFSRGAATARIFVNQFWEKYNQDNNLLSGAKPTIRFLGLYDTVGSIGLRQDGHNFGYNLNINPDAVTAAVQLAAHNEFRDYFPLNSLKTKDNTLAPNFTETTLLGAHSDVGGGYGPVPRKIYLDSNYIKFGGKPPKREQQKLQRIEAQKEKWKTKWQSYLDDKFKSSDQLEFVPRRAQKNGPEGQPNSHRMLLRYVWTRGVKKTLAHVGLHAMFKHAKANNLPLKGMASLSQLQPALDHAIPPALKNYATALFEGKKILNGEFDSIYPNFIHHSAQFKIPAGGLGLVNANSIGKAQRKVFFNQPKKGKC